MVEQFNYPTTILFGAGALAALAERLGREGKGSRFLLVADRGVVGAGLAARVTAALQSSGLSVHLFDSVHPNPLEEDVVSGARAYRAGGFQGIIGLGGGSPMDVAKAIAVLATHQGPLERFDDSKGGDRFIEKPLPPIFAIPTTAGTGSEVGRSAVIIIERTRVKTIIFHPTLLPRIAVLDPELTVGLPASITAATGMDAFTHGLESYFCRRFHPMADSIGLGCMELVIEALPRAVERGTDLEARGKMLLAASMGATAFQKGLGVVHSLAHPLSTRYGMHHGLTNGLLMPPALSYQLEERGRDMTDDLRGRYRRVARLFPGREAAGPEALPQAIAEFCRRVGLRESLGSLGLRREDIPDLAREAFQDPCHSLNPIPITEKDLAAIYQRCLG
jgi:4-hydroxybutyrate dehydrogenase